MDQKGFIFSLDVYLSLVIIVLILGISADAMDIAGNRVDDFCSEQSYQRITGDACDILIKTSGSPENWEVMPPFTVVSPGLADTRNSSGTNILSMEKIKALEKNPELMDNLIPEGFKCSVSIYPNDPSLPTVSVVNQTPNFNTEVYVANRTVVYSYNSYIIYSSTKIEQSLDGNFSHYNCPHSLINHYTHEFPDFKNNKPGWVCDVFNIAPEKLDSTDFYLMTDPPQISDKKALWMINAPDDLTEKVERFEDHTIDITRRIRNIGNGGVLVFHVYTSAEYDKPFRVYVIGVPTGTPSDSVKINYLGLKSGYFILKIWN
jgi:hypothetical protein